ncbi:MAG: S49 family peptidase, partial [Betaproteobacteria bacterium]|nr:S49 family peptidase [Betaproteobacteria bacterium]
RRQRQMCIRDRGGSAVGSEFIRQALERFRQRGKPVVISMGDLAASGGYWISLSADRIIAHPNTITGSIGVFGLLPTAQGLMDKLSIRTGGYQSHWLAGGFDPRVDLDPRMKSNHQRLEFVVVGCFADFLGGFPTADHLGALAALTNFALQHQDANVIATGLCWLERRIGFAVDLPKASVAFLFDAFANEPLAQIRVRDEPINQLPVAREFTRVAACLSQRLGKTCHQRIEVALRQLSCRFDIAAVAFP